MPNRKGRRSGGRRHTEMICNHYGWTCYYCELPIDPELRHVRKAAAVAILQGNDRGDMRYQRPAHIDCNGGYA